MACEGEDGSLLRRGLLACLVVIEEHAKFHYVGPRSLGHVVGPSKLPSLAGPSGHEALVHQPAEVRHYPRHQVPDIGAREQIPVGKAEPGLIGDGLRLAEIYHLGKMVVAENEFVGDRGRNDVYQVPRPA